MIIRIIGDEWLPEEKIVVSVIDFKPVRVALAALKKKLDIDINKYSLWPTLPCGRRIDTSQGAYSKERTWADQGVKQGAFIYVRERQDDEPASPAGPSGAPPAAAAEEKPEPEAVAAPPPPPPAKSSAPPPPPPPKSSAPPPPPPTKTSAPPPPPPRPTSSNAPPPPPPRPTSSATAPPPPPPRPSAPPVPTPTQAAAAAPPSPPPRPPTPPAADEDEMAPDPRPPTPPSPPPAPPVAASAPAAAAPAPPAPTPASASAPVPEGPTQLPKWGAASLSATPASSPPPKQPQPQLAQTVPSSTRTPYHVDPTPQPQAPMANFASQPAPSTGAARLEGNAPAGSTDILSMKQELSNLFLTEMRSLREQLQLEREQAAQRSANLETRVAQLERALQQGGGLSSSAGVSASPAVTSEVPSSSSILAGPYAESQSPSRSRVVNPVLDEKRAALATTVSLYEFARSEVDNIRMRQSLEKERALLKTEMRTERKELTQLLQSSAERTQQKVASLTKEVADLRRRPHY